MAYKVVTRKIASPNGGFGYAIKQNDAALRIFGVRQRSQTISKGINRAVANWRAKYFWKRFHVSHVTKAPWNYKLDRKSPLQWRNTGKNATRNAVFAGRITTRKRRTGKGGPTLYVTRVGIPQGHATHPEIIAVWNTVPADEVQWMVDEAASNIAQIIATGGPKRKKPSKKVMEARRLRRNETARNRYASRKRSFRIKG